MSPKVHYEIPFDFSESVPLLKAQINGHTFERFLLDTGAPVSSLHRDAAAGLSLSPDKNDTVRADSLRIGELEFGPLALKVGSYGSNRLDGLLGTRELTSYRVTLDLDCSVCIIDRGPTAEESFTALELFRGRPVLRIEHAGSNLTFVLDTGSSANWLFPAGQDKLGTAAKIIGHSDTAKSANGEIEVHRAMVVHDMSVGSRKHSKVRFLLPETGSWLDGPYAVEDGILGVGTLASSGRVVIDFLTGKFLFAGNIAPATTQSTEAADG